MVNICLSLGARRYAPITGLAKNTNDTMPIIEETRLYLPLTDLNNNNTKTTAKKIHENSVINIDTYHKRFVGGGRPYYSAASDAFGKHKIILT